MMKLEMTQQQVELILSLQAKTAAAEIQLMIVTMASHGMQEQTIVQTLKRDLIGGGPIFGGIKNKLKSGVMAGLDTVTQSSLYTRKQTETWLTTSGKPCPDCEPRHGQSKTHDEWSHIGLPRSGFSICGNNCMCILVPSGQVKDTDIGAHIEVPTLQEARSKFQDRLKTDTVLQKKIETYRKERNRLAKIRRQQKKIA